MTTTRLLYLHDLPSLSPVFRSGPPFVIRSVIIGCVCPGLKMTDLNEKEFGGERGGHSIAPKTKSASP